MPARGREKLPAEFIQEGGRFFQSLISYSKVRNPCVLCSEEPCLLRFMPIKTFYEQPHVQPWITHPGPTGCPEGVNSGVERDQEAEDLF